jgi:hypothetical protein
MSVKLEKAKIFSSLAEASIYSYIMWLCNRSLNFVLKLKLWRMRVFQASSVIEILKHVKEDEISLLA